MRAFGASDAYVNYLGDEATAVIRASYGANYERLLRLKAKYDPENVFRETAKTDMSSERTNSTFVPIRMRPSC